jgi:hypothetical protein
MNLKDGLMIEDFLLKNFTFRKLGIYEFFGNKEIPVFWTTKTDSSYLDKIDNCDDPCELLDEQVFSDWAILNNRGLNCIFSEFRYAELMSKFKVNLTSSEIKLKIKYLIEQTNIAKTISFNPFLKSLIAEGRYKVKNIKPLSMTDPRRQNITARKGDKLYICKDVKPPFVANPCYVTNDIGLNTYRVIFFTNVKSYWEDTKMTKINGWGFATVDADELGRTPEEAVRQKRY